MKFKFLFIPILAFMLSGCSSDSNNIEIKDDVTNKNAIENNIPDEKENKVENKVIKEEKNDNIAANEEKKEKLMDKNENKEEEKQIINTPKEKTNTNESTKNINSGKTSNNNLGELEVHFINVGQGDSTLLIHTLNGKKYVLLIDAGNWKGNEVSNYLNKINIKDIDILIGTHPDADHIGQMDKVLNNFNVDEVWLSGNTNESQTFNRMLQAINNEGSSYDEPRKGDEYQLGNLKIITLSPNTISEKDNEESLSFKISLGEIDFIFTGDADKNNESKMVNSGINLDAEILHVGHHGSNTSSDKSFVKAVSPDVAIYSAGLGNSYGHPHKSVLDLLNSFKVKVYGTDVNGDIIIKTDGKKYSIKESKTGIPKAGSFDTNTNTNTNTDKKTNLGYCININKASKEELLKIVHIGDKRADEITQKRSVKTFNTVNDLSSINGIGTSRLNDILNEGLACVK